MFSDNSSTCALAPEVKLHVPQRLNPYGRGAQAARLKPCSTRGCHHEEVPACGTDEGSAVRDEKQIPRCARDDDPLSRLPTNSAFGGHESGHEFTRADR